MRCYRKILYISYTDNVTNEEVCAKTIVKRRELKWRGHVSRSSGPAKTILQGTVKGEEHKADQKKRREDNIEQWTGLDPIKSQRAVENREKWTKLVVKSSVVPQRPPRSRDRWRWRWNLVSFTGSPRSGRPNTLISRYTFQNSSYMKSYTQTTSANSIQTHTWETAQQARKVTFPNPNQIIGKPITLESESTNLSATIPWPVDGRKRRGKKGQNEYSRLLV